MEAVLLGLDEAVCTGHSLLWTLTSTALRRIRVHGRNLPAPLHLLHTQRCYFSPLYQVGSTSCTLKTTYFISMNSIWCHCTQRQAVHT